MGKRKWFKRSIAWILCVLLMTGILSSAAVAEEGDGGTTPTGAVSAAIDSKSKIKGATVYTAPHTFSDENSLTFEINSDLKDITWNDTNSLPNNKPNLEFGDVSIKVSGGYNKTYTVTRLWQEQWDHANGNSSQWGPSEVWHDCPIGRSGKENTETKNYHGGKNNSATLTFDGLGLSSDEAMKMARLGVKFRAVFYVTVTSGNKTTQYCVTSREARVIYKGLVIYNYNYNNKGTYETLTFTAGDSIEKPEDPQREGFEFTGWYLDSACKNKFDFEKMSLYERTTLYAGWSEQKTTVKVTFTHRDSYPYSRIRHGIEDVVVPNHPINTPIAEPTEELKCQYDDDHAFMGWYSDAARKNVFTFKDAISEDIVLYGKWGYEVVFDLNGHGTGTVANGAVAPGECLSAPTAPEDPDYAFGGWYTSKNCRDDEAFDFEKAVSNNLNSGFTLYAKWTKFEVSYGLDATEADKEYYVGEELDYSKLVILVTKNNLTTRISAVDNEDVSVTGFNSNTVGKQTLTVFYKNNRAGEYEVTVKEALKELSISVDDEEITYDGNEHRDNVKLNLSGVSADDYTISFNDSPLKAGNYTATLKLTETGEEKYVLGTSECTFTITPRELVLTWNWEDPTYYDGTKKMPGVTVGNTAGNETGLVKVTEKNGKASISAGSYTAVASIEDSNYTLPSNFSFNYEIKKKNSSVTVGGDSANITVTYGESVDVNLEVTEGATLKVTNENSDVIGVATGTGKITITAKKVSPDNVAIKLQVEADDAFNASEEVTIYVKVIPLTAELEWIVEDYVYDGTEKCPSVRVKNALENDTFSFTIEGAQKDAGTRIKATLTSLGNSNYRLEDNNANYTFYKIKPKGLQVSWTSEDAFSHVVMSEWEEEDYFIFEYDGEKKAPVVVLTGFVENESADNKKVVLDFYKIDFFSDPELLEEIPSEQGTYGIEIGSLSDNYCIAEGNSYAMFDIMQIFKSATMHFEAPKCGDVLTIDGAYLPIENYTECKGVQAPEGVAAFAEEIPEVVDLNQFLQEVSDDDAVIEVEPIKANIYDGVTLDEKNGNKPVYEVWGSAVLPQLDLTGVETYDDLSDVFFDALNNAYGELGRMTIKGGKTYSIVTRVELYYDDEDEDYSDWEIGIDVNALKKSITAYLGAGKDTSLDLKALIFPDSEEAALCNAFIVVVDVVAPHIPGEATKEDETFAECEKAGGYDNVTRCTACNEELGRVHVDVEPSGHKWDYKWVTVTEATALEEGVEVCHCENNPEHELKRSIAKIDPTVESITIIADGAKTEYYVGDKLVVDGLKIQITKTDKTTQTIPVTEDMVYDFSTAKPVKGLVVTIKYSGKSGTYKINVSDKPKDEIEITIPDNIKKEYDIGDPLDTTGITITVKSYDGTVKKIDVTPDMVTGFDSSKPNTALKLTITYEGASKDYTVAIIAYTVTGNTSPKSTEDLFLIIHRNVHDEITFSLFVSVWIDGKKVDPKNYSGKSGSLELTVFKDYLKTLPSGEHKIEVEFKDGKAEASITVPVYTNEQKDSPKTSETAKVWIWLIFVAVASAALAMARVYSKKRLAE